MGMGSRVQKTYVHDTTVDITELLEAEEASPVGTIIEDIALNPRQQDRAMNHAR